MGVETTLSSSWHNITQMWSHSYYDINTNISLQTCFDVVGAQASIPNANSLVNPESNYALSGSLYALSHNYASIASPVNSGFFRKMISGSSYGDLCNTFFIVSAGAYDVINYDESTNIITKNGSTAATLNTGRGDFSSLGSLSVGDIIHGSQPFSIGRNTVPGLQGAYGGYAGFCFASRRDRNTVNFYVQNLSMTKKANVQILFTATSDSNVTSMTSVLAVELNPIDPGGGQGFDNSYSTTTTGNYFILSDTPICAWRGQAPSNDVMPLYPLSSEQVYGWFSGNGHTFAVNNAKVGRTNSGGGGTIKGMASDGGTANICTPNSGKDNIFASDGASGTLTGGSYFSGDCCVVYDNSALATSAGQTLFGAESQADGNGSEMTPFTGKKAFGRFTMTNGGSAWNAFISHGFSGSTPSADKYADVIMRFSKSDMLLEAKSFSGNNTSAPFSSKAYFGDGSGTGVSADVGDYFLCNVEVQGWQDTDSADKDETVMIMTNEVVLPTAYPFTLYAGGVTSGTPGQVEPYNSAENACTGMTEGTAASGTVYSPSSTLSGGDVLFWDQNFLYPVNGQNGFVGYGISRNFYEFQLGYNGILLDDPQLC